VVVSFIGGGNQSTQRKSPGETKFTTNQADKMCGGRMFLFPQEKQEVMNYQ
jgi:hypothetical protein